jgi:hypothetical protein
MKLKGSLRCSNSECRWRWFLLSLLDNAKGAVLSAFRTLL